MGVDRCRLSCWIARRRSLAVFLLSCLLLSALCIPVRAQEKKMVAFQQEPAEKVFKKLSALYKVRFFYTGAAVDKDETITMSAAERSLGEVLQYLETNYRFVFRRNDNNMIGVSKRSAGVAALQERVIRGRVGLYDGGNIVYNAGVTIREEGSNNATVTDDKGYFTLKLKTAEALLNISCIGFESNRQEVGANTLLNVTLKQAVNSIPEVVISTGYQQLAKKNTTGAYTSISAQEIARRSSQSITDVLEGSVPGLTLATAYAKSGNDVTQNGIDIQVRGGSAVQTGRNSPLIVVDGFPVNQLPDNLNDVEKIDVLRDAAAAAVWGARAANGVIVITTKRGKEGRLRVNYAANTYFTQKPDYSKLFRASGADVVDYDKEAYDKGFIESYIFDGIRSGYSPSIANILQLNRKEISAAEFTRKQDSLGALSNRQQVRDLLMRTGIRQNHYLSLSGGGNRYRFLVSGSYDDNRSNYIGDRDQRIQLNTRSDFELTRFLRMNVDLNGVFQNTQYGLDNISSLIQQLPPYQLLLDPKGNYLYDYTSFNPIENERLKKLGYLENGRNPLEDARLANNRQRDFGLRSNIGVEWKIIDGLTLNTNFLVDRMKYSGKDIQSAASSDNRTTVNQYATLDANNQAGFNLPKGDILKTSEQMYNNWALRAQLNYSHLFASRHFVVLAAGTEIKKYVTEGYTTTKYGYNDDLQSWQVYDQRKLLEGGLTWWDGNPVPVLDPTSDDKFSFNDIREQSIYMTGAYTYNEKYTLSGSYRVDQSNLFGTDPKYRRTPLWSAGMAWDMAREDFFHVPGISTLKLRATVGLTGNYDRNTTPLLVARREFQAKLNDYRARLTSYNPKLRWERTRTYNYGVDVGLLDGRLQVSLDAYHKYSYDLLGTTLLDPTVGASQLTINAAKMVNNGVELAFQGNPIERGPFKWMLRLNAGYNKNKITDNKAPDGDPVQNRVRGTVQYVEGYSRESLWSYRWARLDDRGNPLVYGDKDEKTKQPVMSSLVYNGNYRAPFSASITNVLQYKDFFVSAFVMCNIGNVLRREMPDMYGYGFAPNLNYQVRDRWRKPGDEAHTDIASITPSFDPADFYIPRSNIMLYSDNSVIPGDYIRLREVQLGYKLPAGLLQRTFLRSVSFIAQMNNVALWTKNKYGIDPEAIAPFTGTYFLPAPRVTTLTLRVEL